MLDDVDVLVAVCKEAVRAVTSLIHTCSRKHCDAVLDLYCMCKHVNLRVVMYMGLAVLFYHSSKHTNLKKKIIVTQVYVTSKFKTLLVEKSSVVSFIYTYIDTSQSKYCDLDNSVL